MKAIVTVNGKPKGKTAKSVKWAVREAYRLNQAGVRGVEVVYLFE